MSNFCEMIGIFANNCQGLEDFKETEELKVYGKLERRFKKALGRHIPFLDIPKEYGALTRYEGGGLEMYFKEGAKKYGIPIEKIGKYVPVEFYEKDLNNWELARRGIGTIKEYDEKISFEDLFGEKIYERKKSCYQN